MRKKMAGIHDLIEDWIQMRAALQRQLKLFESGELGTGPSTDATIVRIRIWIDELNSLLKTYSSADRT
jgi:hypothetical protein